MVSLDEKLRQGSLERGAPYSYAHFCLKLGIPEDQIEDIELYWRGKELIDSGYTPKPIEPPAPMQLSNLEHVADEEYNVRPYREFGSKKERIAAFLDEAIPVINHPDEYGTINLVDILRRYFRKFNVGGSQPLVLPGEIVGENHIFNKYKMGQIETIFQKVYDFYSRKVSK